VEKTLGLLFFVLYWVVFLYSIVLHEVAHGWVAFRLGDPTAYREGRITLNPIKHIDPVWSLIVPLATWLLWGFPFGAAKPVPVNPLFYRNQRWGQLMDAAAGPFTNLLIGCFMALGLQISKVAAGATTLQNLPLTGRFFAACLLINVLLAVFNMLPIPPLDGSHVLAAFLPASLRRGYESLRAWGFIPLMIVLLLNRLANGLILTVPILFLGGLILWGMGVISGVEDYGQLLPYFSPMQFLKGG